MILRGLQPGCQQGNRADHQHAPLAGRLVNHHGVNDDEKGRGAQVALRDGARIELGLRNFLEEGSYKAFTTTFEDLHGLKQLPGLAVQRLMADGYGFGAEGDWKTAALVRALGYERAHIIGHSNGGNVALVTLLEHPEVVQTCIPQAANAYVTPYLIDREPAVFDPERVARSYPHQLSGGMRQRVMIAMALANEPDLLIADEPTTALDVTIQAQILELMKSLQQELGMSILYITHDLATAYQISENIVVLYRGSVAEAGDVERVVKRPQHPYTQLLISSIPVASAERSWTSETAAPAIQAARLTGCKFADRCPAREKFKLGICTVKEPDLIQASPSHKVRCWLYQ